MITVYSKYSSRFNIFLQIRVLMLFISSVYMTPTQMATNTAPGMSKRFTLKINFTFIKFFFVQPS